jgi:cell fate regulator YaaT (PSP1 superfamily)
MITLVGVQLPDHGRISQYEDSSLALSIGDPCVVEHGPGEFAFGHMASNYIRLPQQAVTWARPRVLRKATEHDLKRQEHNEQMEREAVIFCKQRISELELTMKLEKVFFAFDGEKVTFYYTADDRIDFRQLVRDLAKEFKVRIEMRQIGARDLAAMTGGCDSCGEELCCARNLKEFKPVPIRMAKDQNHTGNPDKLTGVCGRLKCCLLYEHPTYAGVKGSLPGPGKTVRLAEGRGRVAKIDIFTEEVIVILEDGRQVAVQGDRIRSLSAPDGPADE